MFNNTYSKHIFWYHEYGQQIQDKKNNTIYDNKTGEAFLKFRPGQSYKRIYTTNEHLAILHSIEFSYSYVHFFSILTPNFHHFNVKWQFRAQHTRFPINCHYRVRIAGWSLLL